MELFATTKKHDFIITNHVRERFVERFSEENRKEYAHLSRCRDTHNGCEICKSLAFKLHREVLDNRRYLDKVICARLHEAKETRIHHNNVEFMNRMYSKYGYQRFRFLIHEDILFVVIETEDGKVAVTCFDAKNSVVGDYVRRPKYRKKEVALV